MTQILSRTAPAFDISSGSFRRSAGDLGETIALLAGGVRPDPEALSRLCVSLRTLQGFLLDEADQQEAREAVAAAVSVPFDGNGDPVRAFLPVTLSAPPYAPAVKGPEEIAEGRRLRASA